MNTSLSLGEEPQLIIPREKKGYDYVRKGILGHGTYGSVYLCMRQGALDPNPFCDIFYGQQHHHSDFCAIKAYKKINKEEDGLGVDISSLREITLLLSINHPNLLSAYQVMADKEQLKVVMEYQLELKEIINDDKLLKDEQNKRLVCYQLLKGLEYLHNNHIFHRDLKPENVFVSKDGVVKIGDFGFSKFFGFPNRKYTPGVCTPHYRAPQLFFAVKHYNEKIDIWSVGCIVFSIFTGQTLFDSDGSQVSAITKIFSITGTPTQQTWVEYEKLPKFAQFQPFPKKNLAKTYGISEEVADFIQLCIQLDPKKRPSASTLLKHPFFDSNRNYYQTEKLKTQALYEKNLHRELSKKTV